MSQLVTDQTDQTVNCLETMVGQVDSLLLRYIKSKDGLQEPPCILKCLDDIAP
jgi:hypothetical protein